MLVGMWNGCSRRVSSRSRHTRILLIIAACSLLSNIVFIRSVLTGGTNEASSTILRSKSSSYHSILAQHFVLTNHEYRLEAVNDTYLNCAEIASLVKKRDYIASGWTKSTYRGIFNSSIDVAVKVVNTNGHDVSECLERDTLEACHRNAGAKVLNEIVYLSWLNHANIARIYGYCVPEDHDTGALVIVTELGEPLDIIRLLQMSWEDRLRVSLGLARLLFYMSHNIHGPVLVSDFRRQQFILHDAEIKLSDLDDVRFGDPACSTACEIADSIQVPCISNRCQNFAERSNILKTGRHFMSFLLMPNTPRSLEYRVLKVIEAYQNASWTAQRLLQETELIVELFSYGSYRPSSKSQLLNDYTREDNSDLEGHHDYRCRMSLWSNGCVLSAFDEEEAAEMCSSDIACKAFVVTQKRSWSGRKIIYLKNGYDKPTYSNRTTLYSRRG